MQPESPRLCILPSTHEHLQASLALSTTGQVEWVAAGIPQAQHPASVLARIAAGERPQLHLYPDRSVGPEDAPIPALRSGTLMFLPALEALLVSRYHYCAEVWTGAGMVQLTHASFEQVLQLLARHLEDCEQLGERWLARSLQFQRLQTFRLRVVNTEIRRFRSAALYAYAHDQRPLDQRLRSVLEQADGIVQLNRSEACVG